MRVRLLALAAVASIELQELQVVESEWENHQRSWYLDHRLPDVFLYFIFYLIIIFKKIFCIFWVEHG